MSQFQRSITASAGLNYQPELGLTDDVFDAQGQQQPHWQYLLNALEQMGEKSFADRQAKALRILRDDGATYHVYGEATANSRTWELDLVPSLITSDDWRAIEAGLVERSELLNLLLKDIYGERSLIKQGVIPPEALLSHRGFLRPCDGIQLPGEHELILHATDLMRSDSGEICILTDRTQCPSGAGYALENRTVMSRVLPSLYRDSHVHRLAGFFQRLRKKLYQLSPNQENPRVVLLTPGPFNEAYFEHAYIANYLGINLVQSGDLVVRNGYLWMKSLDGLNRVDVVLRRVDDAYCDPVELRGDSQLGVAGLLGVARAGNVVIANPLGSGILENPIFLKYMPAIAQHLLGRELRLPQVPSFWCGDEQDRAYVLSHLKELVVKPIFRRNSQPSQYGALLTNEQLAQLAGAIKAKPQQFIAQPALQSMQTPTYVAGQLRPRPSILRTFSVASDTSYELMPGGLTRVSMQPSAFVITNQSGSMSKDTWVLASEPERMDEPAEAAETKFNEAERVSLPSRVAENLFWLGRNAERAESALRLLRTVFIQLNAADLPASNNVRRHLLATVSTVTDTLPGFVGASDAQINSADNELIRVVRDGNLAGSVRSSLNAIISCADQVTELLSSDMLRVVNDIRDALDDLDEALNTDLSSAPEEALDPLVSLLMALSGLAHESMVRDVGWHFLELGRRLERAAMTGHLIEQLLVPVFESDTEQRICVKSLLLSLESLISYRRRYRSQLAIQSCLDLIMLDATNPRSLIYQIDTLKQHIGKLPPVSNTSHELSTIERLVLEAETLVKLPLLNDFAKIDQQQRPILAQQLSQLRQVIKRITYAVSDIYFDHRETSQQLVNRQWDFNE